MDFEGPFATLTLSKHNPKVNIWETQSDENSAPLPSPSVRGVSYEFLESQA